MSIGNNLGNGIADATFALNNNILAQSNLLQRDLMGGFANVGNAVNDARFASQQCCCETNRNIDAVRYEGSQNTCAITTNATANTQKILDKLASMEFNAMKSENENLRMALANERNINIQYMQTKDIIGAVRPFPVPSFQVGSPYGVATNVCPCSAYNA